jgi:RNA polymerase sigma-70 factor (ECF subfamily)
MEYDVIDHIFYLAAHQQKHHEQKYHVQNSCVWTRLRSRQMVDALKHGEQSRISGGREWRLSSATSIRFPVSVSAQPTTLAIAESNLPDVPNVSDESLLNQICIGDGEALAALFERYARLTRSVAVRILRDTAEAEDLVQDLFLYIQRKCGIFDSSKSSARSWIVQMAYHRALDRRRYLKAREFYAQPYFQSNRVEAVGKPTTESDYSAEAVLGRNGLDKIVNELSGDQRETLRLHFFEGYTLLEVSEKLGQPLGNVRHHYYRALDKLRKEMFANDRQPTEGCAK